MARIAIIFFGILFSCERKRRIFWSIADSSWGSFVIVQLGLVESKMAIEGRQMIMMLGPNKTVVAKLQSTSEKSKAKGQDNGKPSPENAVAETQKEAEPQDEPETQEEPETAPLMVDT